MPLIDLHSDYRECGICVNDRAWEKRKGIQVRKKFKLCECENSNKFLNAINFHKDDVLSRRVDFKQHVLKSTQNGQCINELNATCNA